MRRLVDENHSQDFGSFDLITYYISILKSIVSLVS